MVVMEINDNRRRNIYDLGIVLINRRQNIKGKNWQNRGYNNATESNKKIKFDFW